VFFKPFADRSNSTLVCIRRWVGSMENPNFAKQNDRNSAARPLADIPTKLLKEGFDVLSTASCRLREEKRSAQGCAGASASSNYSTMSQYQA